MADIVPIAIVHSVRAMLVARYPQYSAISSSSRFSTSCFSAWRAIGLKSPSHSKALISRIARDTFVGVACSSSIGVPSSCLCSSHNSGGSTPSLFSQSKYESHFPLHSLSPTKIYTQCDTSPEPFFSLTCVLHLPYFLASLGRLVHR